MIIRRFVAWYIRRNMAHECKANRDAIFTAINAGMTDAFYEDNVYTRMCMAVKWLTDNNSQCHPYPFLGQTSFPDHESLAECAKQGVLESTANDRRPRWMTERDQK